MGVWKTDSDEPLILLSEDAAPKGFQFNMGFVYYIQDSFIVGILLVGMFGKLEQARYARAQFSIIFGGKEVEFAGKCEGGEET